MAEKKEFTTALSSWTNTMTQLVTRDFQECEVAFDEYSKKCAMSAMTSIYQLVGNGNELAKMDYSNLREVIGQAASLKLNANALPRECYFQLRKKKVGSEWVNTVEMGVMGLGNDAILRNFGVNVREVYPVWIVHEGDEFTYPKHRGIEVVPPEWEQKGISNKVIRVVYPIKLANGDMQYLIAERESVKVNLFAHVRNNLMNETFGICENRYKATDKQKAEIEAKKEEIFSALRECVTLDEMLKCPKALPYISGAWTDTPEEMIATKLRNNIVKKYPKDFNNMANKSFVQLDEAYQAQQREIEENESTIEVEIPDEEVIIE